MSDLLDRLLKRSPWRYHDDRERWEKRTYPCARWWCFRRSPAYLAFERGGKSYCIDHVPRPWRYHAGVPPWIEASKGMTGSVYAEGGEYPVVHKPHVADAEGIVALRNRAPELLEAVKAAKEYRQQVIPNLGDDDERTAAEQLDAALKSLEASGG